MRIQERRLETTHLQDVVLSAPLLSCAVHFRSCRFHSRVHLFFVLAQAGKWKQNNLIIPGCYGLLKQMHFLLAHRSHSYFDKSPSHCLQPPRSLVKEVLKIILSSVPRHQLNGAFFFFKAVSLKATGRLLLQKIAFAGCTLQWRAGS